MLDRSHPCVRSAVRRALLLSGAVIAGAAGAFPTPPVLSATPAPQEAPTPPSAPPRPSPADEEAPSPAEIEWQKITDDLTPKLVRLREMAPEERQKQTFRAELARIGEFVRKYQASEPDVAASARVFMATQVLWKGLGRDAQAVDVLRDVTATAQGGVVAGLAALSAGEILLRAGDEAALRQLYDLYARRADADALFRDALEGLCRQVRLQPGRLFPAIELHDLAGRRIDPAELRGKLVPLLVFSVEAASAREALVELVRSVTALADPAIAPVGLSLDLDRKKLLAAVDELAIKFPIDCSEKGFDGSAVNELGLTQIPTLIVLDPKGTILFSRAGNLGAELQPLLAAYLEQLRERGELPPARAGG